MSDEFEQVAEEQINDKMTVRLYDNGKDFVIGLKHFEFKKEIFITQDTWAEIECRLERWNVL